MDIGVCIRVGSVIEVYIGIWEVEEFIDSEDEDGRLLSFLGERW